MSEQSSVDEQLYIENFFSIKKFEWDINNLNFLMGPMASGKSVCMKLVYFFEMSPHYLKEATSTESEHISIVLRSKLEEILGIRKWGECGFVKGTKLTYIFREKNGSKDFVPNGKDIFNLMGEWNAVAEQFEWKFQDEYKKKIDEAVNNIKEINWDEFKGKSIFPLSPAFIPSCRATASTKPLKKGCNLGKDFFLDRFLEFKEEFLKDFEDGDEKKRFKNDPSLLKRILDIDKVEIKKETIIFKKETNASVGGQQKELFELPFLASGQQECLYLLPFIGNMDMASADKLNSLFIEEPSAYLFPGNQLEVIKLLIEKLNEARDIKKGGNSENAFFISTHSTFIIDAINSIILNGKIEKQKVEIKDAGSKEAEDILDGLPTFDINNVSIYEIINDKNDSGRFYVNKVEPKPQGYISVTLIQNLINEMYNNDVKKIEKIERNDKIIKGG